MSHYPHFTAGVNGWFQPCDCLDGMWPKILEKKNKALSLMATVTNFKLWLFFYSFHVLNAFTPRIKQWVNQCGSNFEFADQTLVCDRLEITNIERIFMWYFVLFVLQFVYRKFLLYLRRIRQPFAAGVDRIRAQYFPAPSIGCWKVSSSWFLKNIAS